MNSRTWIVLLVIALLATNAFWLIQILDSGISYTYQSASLDTAERQTRAAVAVANLNLIGLPKDQALDRAKRLETSFSVFEKHDGCIYVSEVCIYANESGVIEGIK